MPGMPEVVAKPLMLERLDEVLNDAGRRGRFANDLRSGGKLIDIAVDHGIARTDLEKRHLREDWFRAWWPTAQNHAGGVEEVMRQGLIAAAEEAEKRGLPVDCYWCCDPGHEHHRNGHDDPEDGEVEVTVSWSKSQITLILQTPHPPPPEAQPGPVLEPIWVIRRMPDHTVGKIQASRPAEPPARLGQAEPKVTVA